MDELDEGKDLPERLEGSRQRPVVVGVLVQDREDHSRSDSSSNPTSNTTLDAHIMVGIGFLWRAGRGEGQGGGRG